MEKKALSPSVEPRELATWDPFREMRALTGMSELFDDLFAGLTRPVAFPTMPRAWTPRTDIQETDKEYVLTVALPGLRKEDVKIAVENGVLTLSGEKKTDKEEKGKDWVRREITQGAFSRSFVLPAGVHPEEIKATCKDGLLTVSIHKPEQQKSRGVHVKID